MNHLFHQAANGQHIRSVSQKRQGPANYSTFEDIAFLRFLSRRVGLELFSSQRVGSVGCKICIKVFANKIFGYKKAWRTPERQGIEGQKPQLSQHFGPLQTAALKFCFCSDDINVYLWLRIDSSRWIIEGECFGHTTCHTSCGQHLAFNIWWYFCGGWLATWARHDTIYIAVCSKLLVPAADRNWTKQFKTKTSTSW